MDIRFFDPAATSRAEWSAYHAYRRVRAEEDLPGEPVLSDADFEHLVGKRWPLVENRRYAAWCGDAVVGNLWLEYRREGTPDHASYAPFIGAGGGVLLPHRRKGIASALLGTLSGFMQAHGKSIVTFNAQCPEANAFLQAAGATEKHRSRENRMLLAGLDWQTLAGWQARVATPAHADLRWEIHAGRVPMERLAQLMAPLTVLINDMPLGELDLPAMRYELPAHVSWYQELDRTGGEHLLVLLMAGDELAAVCNAHWDARWPDRVFQALTAVARPWRGKGLAKAVKAAMLDLVRERLPQVRMITTHNANVNAPMLSINQQLGFTVHRETRSYQIDRASLQRLPARRQP